jgi:hypothetical protein
LRTMPDEPVDGPSHPYDHRRTDASRHDLSRQFRQNLAGYSTGHWGCEVAAE